MSKVARIDKQEREHIERLSNEGLANRHIRLAKELEENITKLKDMQILCFQNDLEARILEGQIVIFEDEAIRQRGKAKELVRGMV